MQHSKRSISTPISDRLLDILSGFLVKKNNKEIRLVLNLLFSQAERIMILKRIGIQYMLLKGNERIVICEILKVSSSTVAYYAIQLETQKDELTAYIKSILLSENMKNMLDLLQQQITYLE